MCTSVKNRTLSYGFGDRLAAIASDVSVLLLFSEVYTKQAIDWFPKGLFFIKKIFLMAIKKDLTL
ncbi:MAG: hypothetical protein AB8F74_07140 [Saprospiraceae bacterium]